jgi:hypothetical protein
MPLVNMKPLLRHAMDNHYAVAAFNLVDYNTTKAMVKAAEELNAPVICQTSVQDHQVLQPQGNRLLGAHRGRGFAGAGGAPSRSLQGYRDDRGMRQAPAGPRS